MASAAWQLIYQQKKLMNCLRKLMEIFRVCLVFNVYLTNLLFNYTTNSKEVRKIIAEKNPLYNKYKHFKKHKSFNEYKK